MLTHAEKYFIVKEGMRSWAVQTFGIIAENFEPDEFDIEERIKEFDADDDGFWDKTEALLREILNKNLEDEKA